ncbi:universal stress protein [Paraburkholderia sp. CNPSo 3157]|uniref:Universal stress protein n=1 Tax=Paraburkholderia franconis TaxID=2654983 RepID=A0A7X1TJI9_9BURK|nr:universal stress protein [Paraburkholderia franconis]MPW21600.1 universal stress protein [Paraburkholderia franconis]
MVQASNVTPAAGSAFTRVMLAVDDSDATIRAAEYARALFGDRAKIRIVTVAQNPRTLFPLGATTQGFLAAAREEIVGDARAVLGKIEAMFPGTDVEFGLVDLSVHNGNTVDALLDAASHWQADLIMMGARHHHGLLRWIEGTVSEPVVRRAGCSLLVVPENSRVPTDRPPERIAFALDGSACSLFALRTGLQMATPDTRLRAIYVVDRAAHLTDSTPDNQLERAFLDEGCSTLERAARMCAEQGRYAETALIKTHETRDDVPHAIMRDFEQWNGDLLVLGTHGRRGLARWFLGSVAARTVRLADTPVLLVRRREDSHQSGENGTHAE